MKKILVIILLLLNSCSENIEQDKNTLTVAVPIEATGLFPYKANDPHSSRVNVLLFDTLIRRDTNGNFEPAIATSWDYISPTILEVTIRSNVYFHNGDLLSLEDVQFSYECILATPNLSHTVDPILRTEITKDNKFRVILKEPYAPLIHLLAYTTFKIINKAYVLSNEIDIVQRPMGTGPYKLKEWNRGQNILLEKNEEYWDVPAHIQKINLRTVNDPVARAIALETGEVDIAYDIEGSDKDRIIDNPDLVLVQREIPRVEYIAMNIGKGDNPLWKDKRGRQAFSYALDLQGIVNSVLFGMGKTGNSLLSPVVNGYDLELPLRNRNIEKSKQLLTDMGIKNPAMNIWVREGVSQKVGEVIQANLAEVGIQASIEIVEYARFLEGVALGDHDVFILNWTAVTADADYGLNNLLNSSSWGSKGNRSFYSNLEVDKLLAEGRTTLDLEKRANIYKKIQNIVYDDVPYIPIYYAVLGVGMNKDVKGFEFDIFSDYPLQKVYFGNQN